jgi:hypothetical protein
MLKPKLGYKLPAEALLIEVQAIGYQNRRTIGTDRTIATREQ